MNRLSLGFLVLGASTLVACDGLKEALTAHVDVVARASSQELSVTRLGDMLGNAKIGVVTRISLALSSAYAAHCVCSRTTASPRRINTRRRPGDQARRGR